MKSGVNYAVLLAAAGIVILMLNVTAAESDTSTSTAVEVPIRDCSNMILYMSDCLPFVRKGSTENKPKGSCCNGLNTVIKSDGGGVFCVCQIFESSAQIGDGINFTKAITLPSVCYLSDSSTINCAGSLALSPSLAPAPAAVVVLVSPAPGGGGSDINYINAPYQPHPRRNTSLASSSSSTLALILSVRLLFLLALVVSPFSLL